MLVRQSRKETVHASNKMVTEMSSDINMSTNPSYDISKEKPHQENQYVNVAHNIQMDTNPPYGTVQCTNNNIPIQENPSYEIFHGTHNAIDEAEHVKMVRSASQENEAEYEDININPS